MKLSIIIPVYKVERTLCRCVESVLAQAFGNFQIILVDDGSPDRCPQMCDEYAEKDKRIKVIHQPNRGLSNARNAGIKNAEGEYITFIDSDDTISKDTLQPLMDIISNHHEYDILEYPAIEWYGSLKKQHTMSFKNHVYDDMRRYWFEEKAYKHTYAWNKIYRKKLFDNVEFAEGRYFEDVFTLPKLLAHCHIVATTNAGLYYYHNNEKGITATAGARELNDLLAAHIQLIGTPLSPMNSADYYAHVLNIQIDVFRLTGKQPVLPKLRASDNITFKIALSKIIGIKRLCQLHSLIHKILNHSR